MDAAMVRDGSTRSATTSPKHVRLDLSGHRRPRNDEFARAVALVDRSGVATHFEGRLRRSDQLNLRINVRAYLVVCVLRGLTPGHRASTTAIVKEMNSLSTRMREELGCPRWRPGSGSYDVVHRLERQVDELLTSAPEADEGDGRTRLTNDWLSRKLLAASLPEEGLERCGIAVDSTAAPTWAVNQRGRKATLPPSGHGEGGRVPLWVGEDGRKGWTKDPHARGGRKSATGKSAAATFDGYDFHLGVATSGLKYTNGVDIISLFDQPPAFILFERTVPANTPSGEAIEERLTEAADRYSATHAVLDRGYSQSHELLKSLHRAGIKLAFDLKEPQRGLRPGPDFVHVVDGHPMSSDVPDHLVDLPNPFAAARQGEAEVEELYHERARFRYSMHTRMADGRFRIQDPYLAGRIAAPEYPKTMRSGNAVPVVAVKQARPGGKPGTVTMDADALPLMQQTLYGTRAHRVLYGTRNVVENVNGRLGQHTDFGHDYCRSFDLSRRRRAFTFLAVAFNMMEDDRCKRQKPRPSERKRRADARKGWAQVDKGRTPAASHSHRGSLDDEANGRHHGADPPDL